MSGAPFRPTILSSRAYEATQPIILDYIREQRINEPEEEVDTRIFLLQCWLVQTAYELKQLPGLEERESHLVKALVLRYRVQLYTEKHSIDDLYYWCLRLKIALTDYMS